ncbi:MAG: hypothetical protein ACOCRK_10955 [bacterium]
MYIKKRYIFLNCFLPIIIGALIYILFRTTTLLVFSWLKYLNLMNYITSIRLLFADINNVPKWIIFSLPHALWAYSFMFTFLYIWIDKISKFKYFWFLLVIIMTLGGEIGQLLNFVPGTFDFYDLFLSLIACISPFIIVKIGGMKNVYKRY